MTKKQAVKIIIILCCIVFLLLVCFYFFSNPRSVKSFGPFKLGDQAPIVSENVPEYEFIYSLKYKFYIYAMEKNMSYCALEDCGMSGTFVSCMGGWLSADGLSGDGGANDYGLVEEEVVEGKSSIILVADKDKKIIGIYQNYRVQNILYILKNYRDVFERFDSCYEMEMPTKW